MDFKVHNIMAPFLKFNWLVSSLDNSDIQKEEDYSYSTSVREHHLPDLCEKCSRDQLKKLNLSTFLFSLHLSWTAQFPCYTDQTIRISESISTVLKK